MGYENYSSLKINVDRRVAFVTIDHPPFNLMDMPLVMELDRVSKEVQDDKDVRVVVLQSADPVYFVAHVDASFIQAWPRELPPKPTEVNPILQVFERFRTMPKATIGKLDGIARGGGSEFLLSLDMRFAAHGSILGQPETAGGFVTGGGGATRLPRLIGRGRALEVLLGACDIDAETAERWGYVNRAMPRDELTPFVERLAYRIATFPSYAIASMKTVVDTIYLPEKLALLEAEDQFNQNMMREEARERLAKSFDLGIQRSREDELVNIADKLAEEYAVK
ncbi:MAG: putative enoyl-CoA hydratase echA8 [Syntrophorhabdus sp. PtaU1.Bin153]|nr:MAG: putative enoyl-CoA hydratase echA8 [Syntrophorhabdus sp. PtaU1.Bin153]